MEVSVRQHVAASVWTSIVASFAPSVWASAASGIWETVWASLGESIQASVLTCVGPSLWNTVESGVGAILQQNIRFSIEASACAYEKAAWYTFAHFFAVYLEPNDLHAFALFNAMVSGYWLGKESADH
jgi:hypothetical protein